ncbi:MAG: M15 family metallopeptidase [Nocardioides sp.]|nr:M15 family metallopeptidase [Nocardioides sp.]
MPRGKTLRRAVGTTAVLVLLATAAGCGGGERAGAADPGATGQDTVAQPAPPEESVDAADGGTAPVTGLDPAMAVAAPGPLEGRLRSADLLVYAPEQLSPETVQRLEDVDGVTTMLSVSLSQVQVEGSALNVLAVDPRTYRPYTRRESADLQEVWDRLARGEVAVPPSVDKKLIDAGGFLTLGSQEDALSAHVGAYAPQVPFVDVVVNDKVGAEIEMTPGNALLISTGISAPATVQGPVQQIVGADVSVQALDVVAQLGLDINAQQTAFLVGSVGEAVGTYRYTVTGGGMVVPEPSWVSSHISSAVVPILGRVTCNTDLFPQLDAALREIVERGLADTINPGEYAGCYYPRFIAGSNRLSNHAFGLALDLNVPGNGRGTVGEMDRDVVSIFKKWGFAWGGDWGYTDPMHFEMAALVDPR